MDLDFITDVGHLISINNDMIRFKDNFESYKSTYVNLADNTVSTSELIDSITGNPSLKVFSDAEHAIESNQKILSDELGGVLHGN